MRFSLQSLTRESTVREEPTIDRELTHVLYSRGRLVEPSPLTEEKALIELASIMRRSPELIGERLLSGNRKKIKSSPSLEKLLRLKNKLEKSGLDAYIELDSAYQ